MGVDPGAGLQHRGLYVAGVGPAEQVEGCGQELALQEGGLILRFLKKYLQGVRFGEGELAHHEVVGRPDARVFAPIRGGMRAVCAFWEGDGGDAGPLWRGWGIFEDLES
jgi:hypothetical protein